MYTMMTIVITVCVRAQLCPTLWDFMDCSPWLLCSWNFPGKNTGVGCHFFLQGSSQHSDQICVTKSPAFAAWFLYHSLRRWRICVQCQRPGLDPWVRKIPWRRTWHPTPVLLPGESHGQRSLASYSPWGSHRVRHNWKTKTQFVKGASINH